MQIELSFLFKVELFTKQLIQKSSSSTSTSQVHLDVTFKDNAQAALSNAFNAQKV